MSRRTDHATCGTRWSRMSAVDRQVWERYAQTSEFPRWEWSYDVRVGRAAGRQDVSMTEPDAAWWLLSAKRIDAVGTSGEERVIVEVKPRGGATALGQLLVYRHWYVQTMRPIARVSLWVVCSEIDLDAAPLFAEFGVRLVVVGSVVGS